MICSDTAVSVGEATSLFVFSSDMKRKKEI